MKIEYNIPAKTAHQFPYIAIYTGTSRDWNSVKILVLGQNDLYMVALVLEVPNKCKNPSVYAGLYSTCLCLPRELEPVPAGEKVTFTQE